MWLLVLPKFKANQAYMRCESQEILNYLCVRIVRSL